MALKIIGAGMGRTGTASLKVALEILGFGPCYHMSEVLKNPQHIHDWLQVVEQEKSWDSLFADYSATVDNPGCNYWQELADFYPQAKVILTLRDSESWFESTRQTIHSAEFTAFIHNSPFGEMMQKTMWDKMQNNMHDKAFMCEFFEKRSVEIISKIQSERLLVYRVSEGWQPLCRFLGLAIPNQPFPRINSREETKQLIATLLAASGNSLSQEAMLNAGHDLHAK